MERQSRVEARWISVNTRAMSLDHEPRTEFEKAAAEKLGSGQDEYEIVENGYYRRAGAIPLGGGCISCHAGFFKTPPKSPRFAGLIISTPPSDACNTFRAMLDGLRALEAETHRHVHKENSILFPRAIELERRVGSNAN
ncbi:MAG TPA: hypothetical protein VNH11_26195 [Pirellulales bacterium]|nr:hypothetical protein [Pirellulales bacterium]